MNTLAVQGDSPLIFSELREIQRQFGYLPAEELRTLAKKIDFPLYRLHGVASSYPHFRLTPPPRVDVRICQDMSCHLRGAAELRSAGEGAAGQIAQQDVKISGTSCLGRCDQSPAVAVNDQIFSGLTAGHLTVMIGNLLADGPPPTPVESRHRVPCALDPYQADEPYQAIRNFVQSRDAKGALELLKASGLRGLGGAGFPTESKWQMVRQAPAPTKFIVCNADESEPGTIKDRFILSNLPHLVIEGMILAGLLTGAQKGILYIRHEYEEQEKILHDEIARCKREGLVGSSVLGSEFSFDLELFVSPGGYICGEESALLEAIEGKRAEPRNKPPFPVTNGLWDQPTVINNVETFSLATVILARGADWYKAQGKNGSVGMKFVGISGDVVRPGIFEVPMGTSYSDLIYQYAGGIPGGKKLKGFAPSGPSSGYLPASMAAV